MMHPLDPHAVLPCDTCDEDLMVCGSDPETCEADRLAAAADAHNDMLKEDGPCPAHAR